MPTKAKIKLKGGQGAKARGRPPAWWEQPLPTHPLASLLAAEKAGSIAQPSEAAQNDAMASEAPPHAQALPR